MCHPNRLRRRTGGRPAAERNKAMCSASSPASASVDSLTESLHGLGEVTATEKVRQMAKDTELLPVVDLWYDLTAHLVQDEISSPDDLYRERHEIIK